MSREHEDRTRARARARARVRFSVRIRGRYRLLDIENGAYRCARMKRTFKTTPNDEDYNRRRK